MSINSTTANNLMCTIRVTHGGIENDLIVPLSVAKKSITIKEMLECYGDDDGSEGNIIPITNIKFDICKKVFEYCEYIHANPLTVDNIDEWVADYEWKKTLDPWFMEYMNVPEEITVGVMIASNFLNIPSLLKMQGKYIASLIKDKKTNELHEFFKKGSRTEVAAAIANATQ